MSNESVRPTKEEVPQNLDEAFKVQGQDALVVVQPQPPDVPNANEDKVLIALADEDKLAAEKIRRKKQKRLTNKKLGDAMVDVAKWTVRGVVGWYIFVAAAVTAYMIGVAFGITLLPDAALLALIGTVAVAALVGGVSKVIIALRTNSE